MGKILLLAILLLFSVEDIRFKSISEKWFWGLTGFVVLSLLVPPLQIHLDQHLVVPLDLKNFLIMHTGASFFEEFVKSLLGGFFSFRYFHSLSGTSWFTNIVNLISRAGVGFLLLYIPYLITRKKSLGEGDIFYFTLVSCLFPISIIWLSYFLAFFSGCFLFLFLIILIPEKKRKNLCSYKIPFIPFLSLGFVIGLFFQ